MAWIAASVSTRVVSWKEAADSHDSVASDALVIPMRIGRAVAASPPPDGATATAPDGVPPGQPVATSRAFCASCGAPLRAAEWWRRLLAHDAFSSRVWPTARLPSRRSFVRRA